MMAVRYIIGIMSSLLVLMGCSSDTCDVRAACVRDEIGNYIIKWETNPPINGVAKIYVSDTPDKFDMADMRRALHGRAAHVDAHMARLDRDVLGRCPQLSWRGRTAVLVTGGTNDIFYSGSDVAARSNMGAIVHQLAALGLRVAVGAPLPVAPERTPEGWRAAVDFAGARVALERYRSWLRGFCSGFGVPLVPFDLDFLDGRGAAVPELLLDGIHPGPQGHRRMADRCVTWFRQQMEGR